MRGSFASIAGPFALGMLIATTAMADTHWPSRVLITNDNGIDDPGIVELARGLSAITEVCVVAPATDRSGTSNFMGAVRTRRFEVEARDIGAGITAYALDGYPADCVIFGLGGPLRSDPPDLVISGINGGPNLGDAWFGSGTIGAARTAAYFGIPAIALSGLDDDNPHAVKAIVDWVVQLVGSEVVQSLQAPQYLTVSFPMVDPWEIEGVEIVTRARGTVSGSVERIDGAQDAQQTWELTLLAGRTPAQPDSDVAAAGRNNIAIASMKADETDIELRAELEARLDSIPRWVAPAPPEEPECRSGLGVAVQDAEDESGREWGASIVEVMSGGHAERLGLRVGDVIVSVNEYSLVTPPGSSDDPVDVFVHAFSQLDCGDTVILEYVRNGSADRVEFVVASKNR